MDTHVSPETMSSQRQQVNARRAGGRPVATSDEDMRRDLDAARELAKLLDSKFQLGPVKFGLDAIIGLVPVAGDLVSTALGFYPVYLARKHQLGRWIIARMLANLGLDLVMGAVPVAGDAVDILFKAHLKNLRLLEQAIEKKLAGRR